MGPALAKSLNEDIAVLLATSVHFFVEGKRAADFAMDFWVPDFVSQLSSIQIIRKSRVGVVEVLELGPEAC